MGHPACGGGDAMDFSLAFASYPDCWQDAQLAEDSGFKTCWFYDMQLMSSGHLCLHGAGGGAHDEYPVGDGSDRSEQPDRTGDGVLDRDDQLPGAGADDPGGGGGGLLGPPVDGVPAGHGEAAADLRGAGAGAAAGGGRALPGGGAGALGAAAAPERGAHQPPGSDPDLPGGQRAEDAGADGGDGRWLDHLH